MKKANAAVISILTSPAFKNGKATFPDGQIVDILLKDGHCLVEGKMDAKKKTSLELGLKLNGYPVRVFA